MPTNWAVSAAIFNFLFHRTILWVYSSSIFYNLIYVYIVYIYIFWNFVKFCSLFATLLNNAEIKLSRIKSKGGPTTKSKAKAPAWFKEFSDNINKRLDKQEEFNTRIEKQVSNLRSDFDRVIKLNNLKQ